MTKPYFRPGAGTVIYNQDKEVLKFNRTDHKEVWQLQQGGMDAGEKPIDTMWRELVEETGLTENDIAKVSEFPDWTIYAYSEKTNIPDKPYCLGQAHRWYFLELKPNTEIDLSKAHDQEFTDWRWTTFAELIAETSDMKKHVYISLNKYFEEDVAS